MEREDIGLIICEENNNLGEIKWFKKVWEIMVWF